MTLPAFTVVMPKAMSIGGTLMCPNVPLMESLPPIDGRPSSSCIFRAPRRALRGFPHERLSCILSKYSWYENLIFSYEAPDATTLAQASTTEYAAPWYGLHEEMYGLYPKAITLAVSV